MVCKGSGLPPGLEGATRKSTVPIGPPDEQIKGGESAAHAHCQQNEKVATNQAKLSRRTPAL